MRQPQPPEKKSIWQKIWKIAHPVLVSVITFCAIGTLKEVVKIHDYVISSSIEIKNMNTDIANFRVDIGTSKEADSRQDRDLQILVGLLPAKQKELFKPQNR